MKVEIDSQSGFCGGVIRAIGKAEELLATGRSLYSLGDLVHNEAELSRLHAKGLVTLDRQDIEEMLDASGASIIIRAHGEPPETYERLHKLSFEIVDCTCPVVLRLQKNIVEARERMKQCDGTVLIFGKIGHAEVLGLVGQVGGAALVVEDESQLLALIDSGILHTDKPVEIFSQTTKSPREYSKLCGVLSSKMRDSGLLTVHDTICRQVAYRHEELREFAASHDVIIFLSGRQSSNGRVLCDLCKSVNLRTYHVDSVSEIHREWFRSDDSVGICGATSTPKWLLEQAAAYIEKLQ